MTFDGKIIFDNGHEVVVPQTTLSTRLNIDGKTNEPTLVLKSGKINLLFPSFNQIINHGSKRWQLLN